jgi:hypothetical protein
MIAVFEAIKNGVPVQENLMRDGAGSPIVPRQGDYHIVDDTMYIVTRVFWKRKDDELVVRVQGKPVVLAYVLSLNEPPLFEGSVDDAAEWLEEALEIEPKLGNRTAVYLDLPHNKTISVEEFLGGQEKPVDPGCGIFGAASVYGEINE